MAADGQTPITGPLLFLDGSALNPSITFITDDSDGFFHPGSGEVSIALQGIEAFVFSAPSLAAGGGIVGKSGAVLTPIGMCVDFAGSSSPVGWFLCYGQAVSRTTYSELFAAIGTAFGSGDGSTTFNLPDCRGRVVAGKDNMGGAAANRITVAGDNFDGTVLGNTGGAQNITLVTGNLPSHTHTANVTDPTHTHSATGNNNGLSGGGPGALQSGASFAFGTITLANAATGITVTNTNTGSGTSFSLLQPTIIMNKIIFAGHP